MKPKNRVVLLLFFLGSLSLGLIGLVHTQQLLAGNGRSPVGNQQLFLPLVSKALDCSIPGANYSSIPIASAPTDRPAAQHPDINLAIRGYAKVSAPLNLVNYAGNIDPNAPQLDTLFKPARVPNFTNAYQIYRWDWSCNCRRDLITDWPTTLLGMGTSSGEAIHVPDSGYDIGGGNDVMVLYATSERITLKYTREDSVAYGYAIHIEDVCVDPALVRLYNTLNAAGRAELPALNGGHAFGRAISNEIKVSIRDTGSFLDPRSRKDWWQDH